VPVAYVSAEPFPGHFGIGGLPGGEKMLGMFFKRQKIEGIFDVAMEEIVPGEMRLTDGRKLPFKYAMVIPPFVGAEVIKASGLGNAKGFIDVKDTYQTLAYPNVYAAGIAAAVNAPWQSANAVGVPKTGFPAETMAHVAAENIASQIRGEEPTKEENFADIPAVCIMDAGNNGVVILADKMLPPRKHGVMIPGPQSHVAKIAFEKYFLWTARHGYVNFPFELDHRHILLRVNLMLFGIDASGGRRRARPARQGTQGGLSRRPGLHPAGVAIGIGVRSPRSGAAAPQGDSAGREAGDDQGDEDDHVRRLAAVERCRPRCLYQRVVGVGERENLGKHLQPAGHLIAGDDEAAQQELGEHEGGQKLHGLELGSGEGTDEQAHRGTDQGIGDGEAHDEGHAVGRDQAKEAEADPAHHRGLDDGHQRERDAIADEQVELGHRHG
jgi:hypothetical protein